MILLSSLNLETLNFKKDNYHYYIFKNDNSFESYIEIDEVKASLLEIVESSLMSKEGVFFIKDFDSFIKSCKQDQLRKHYYIEEDCWFFLSKSLKNHVSKLDLTDIISFNEDNLSKRIKKILS